MVDRVVDPVNDAPVEDISDVLKSVFVYVLNEAADKMDKGEDVIPFTGLAIKENLFIEPHDYETAEETYLHARREVEGARGATAYAFCYDGYIQTDDGMKDCLIAEGGLPGEEQGYAFGYLYDEDGIDRSIIYIGPAPNFMSNLKLELEVEANFRPDPASLKEVEEAFGIFDEEESSEK